MSEHLELRGIRRTFPDGQEPILAGVDLQVPAGGCVALLGPSGAGKSTTLRVVAGLDRPDSGSVLLGGRDLAGIPTERRRTAMVFQRPRLFPHLSVRDNVAFPLVVAGDRRRRARLEAHRFLELVGAAELAARRPSSLSGGQEQRVALARALAAHPDVLLLDEPFSGLDPSVRSEMHRLLAELRAAVEPTILLVTHDRGEASVVADTIAVLLDGRIAQHGRVDRLYLQPSGLAVSRFLGGLNEVPGHVEAGCHRSAFGRLDLPAHVEMTEGPGTLLVRQEAVSLVCESDPSADGTGVIEQVAPVGARFLVRVRTAAGLVHAELPPGATAGVGAAVGVVLPLDQRWVVPSGSDQPAPQPVLAESESVS